MRKNLLFTPLMVALAASPFYGQDMTEAVFSGKVTTASGTALKGVRVQLSSPALLQPRTAVTDDQGNFRARMLPGGEYSITYSLSGYLSRRMTAVLVAGVTANGSTRMTAADVESATVVIDGGGNDIIRVDKTDTVVQTAFTADRMEEIGNRSIQFLQTLTPGAQGNILAGYSIRGGLARGARTLLNGQNVTNMYEGTLSGISGMHAQYTDPELMAYGGVNAYGQNVSALGNSFLFNQTLAGVPVDDLIESMAVIQSPLSAKYGNTDSGMISIVTKRGTNAFQGSIRFKGFRGSEIGNGRLWSAVPSQYPNRLGYNEGSTAPGDSIMRTWEFTLSGPIVPNYLTFSYGGSLTPAWVSYNLRYNGPLGAQYWNFGTQRYLADAKLGTYFRQNDPNAPDYGTVIRESYLGNLEDQWYLQKRSSVNNQYSLFLKLWEGHQLDYYYKESGANNLRNGEYNMIEDLNGNIERFASKTWNLAYKGIIASSGVLDIRWGKSDTFTEMGNAGQTSVRINTLSTLIPQDGNWLNLDPENYSRNGLFHAVNRWYGETLTAAYNPAGLLFGDTVGRNMRGDYGSSTESLNVTYQHIFEFLGQHMFDAGFNRDYSYTEMATQGAERYFSPSGRIKTQLDPFLIYNDAGRTPGALGDYAGRYIVFNPLRATLGSVDPYLVSGNIGIYSAMNYGGTLYPAGSPVPDGPVFADGAFHPALVNTDSIVPNVLVSWGAPHGAVHSTTSSFYLNDLWTINDHHSVMIGLRFNQGTIKSDNFQVVDRQGDPTYIVYDRDRVTPRIKKDPLVSESSIDPRLEYKFALHGDQRRLFAVSYARFTSVASLNTFSMFVDKKWDNTTRMFWTGGNTANGNSPYPYLVDYDELTNLANYTELRDTDTNYRGSYSYEIDPDFKSPTTTEYSVWYRRSYDTGGWWKVAFVHRKWSNLYDFFAGDLVSTKNPMTGAWTNRVMTVMKNTKDFSRQYTGVELSWDIPINRNFAFGGNYTWARQLDNQSLVGSSLIGMGGNPADDNDYYFDANMALQVSGGNSATRTSPAWQTLWHWDEMMEKAGLGGRSVYMPVLNGQPEFKAGYYIILNFSQGRSKSNFTLRGSYTGAYNMYDRIRYLFGYPYIQGVSQSPDRVNPIGGLRDSLDIIVNTYTGPATHMHNLTYNLTMPIVKKLSWYVNVGVNNVFNHRPKIWTVPGGTIGNIAPLTINDYPPYDQFPVIRESDPYNQPNAYGKWRYRNALLDYYKKGGLGARYFDLSTGLRF
jgi:hypothetical protein